MERITYNNKICGGAPTIRGLRISVKTIHEFLQAGESVENILKAYPILEKEDIEAVLKFTSINN